jgi:GntR family transcriptional regulator, galactonate operon transcriptional repressor
MQSTFTPLPRRARLHDQVTRALALRVMEADTGSGGVPLPKESELSEQLGVSRTVLRESMKVLVDKGMVAMKPRAGTRTLPRSEWHLFDPDILAWQAEVHPAPAFLRELCEVRLAIEPTAAGFAALRATAEELACIELCLDKREAMAAAAAISDVIDLDLQFQRAVVAASHNLLLAQLSMTIRESLQMALTYSFRHPANVALTHEAHRDLVAALKRGDPLAARGASEKLVGLAMLAVEEVERAHGSSGKGVRGASSAMDGFAEPGIAGHAGAAN